MNTAVLASMSPQLHARCALAVLAAALLASVMGLLAWGPVPAGPYLHGAIVPGGVEDTALWGVWWLVPTLAATWLGWRAASAAPPGSWREAWQAFFGVAALAALTAGFEQLAPGALGLVLVRVPAASAYAVVSLLFVAERLGPGWVSRPALAAALLAGPAAGLICAVTQLTTGVADVRALLWLAALPVVMVPLGIWGLQSRGLTGVDWLVALGLQCVSEAMHGLDLARLAWPAGQVAVHGVHHLALLAALGWLAHALSRQRRFHALRSGAFEVGAASQRSTSRNTSER